MLRLKHKPLRRSATVPQSLNDPRSACHLANARNKRRICPRLQISYPLCLRSPTCTVNSHLRHTCYPLASRNLIRSNLLSVGRITCHQSTRMLAIPTVCLRQPIPTRQLRRARDKTMERRHRKWPTATPMAHQANTAGSWSIPCISTSTLHSSLRPPNRVA